MIPVEQIKEGKRYLMEVRTSIMGRELRDITIVEIADKFEGNPAYGSEIKLRDHLDFNRERWVKYHSFIHTDGAYTILKELNPIP